MLARAVLGDVTEEDAPELAASADPTRVRAASLPCESCGRTTPHRILRWDRGGSDPLVRLSGLARCQVCRWTHPFVQRAPETTEVALVVSDGAKSVAARVMVPRHRRLQVGSGVPGHPEALRIRRIEVRGGESVPAALPSGAITVWATREGERSVPVSVVDRDRTYPDRWIVDPSEEVEVGGTVVVHGDRAVVVGLRARGRTWKHPGARFAAADVQRLYVRRDTPPAGSRDWSRVRLRPSSRASSTSSASRSRSGPGTRRARTVPRARTADGGAQVQSDSPS